MIFIAHYDIEVNYILKFFIMVKLVRKAAAFMLMCMSCSFFAAAQTSEVKVVLEEDFEEFTEGSIEAPGTEDISSILNGKLSELLPGWRGREVYEAGGALRIGEDDLTSTSAYLQTTTLSLSPSEGGNIKVSARIKAVNDFGNMFTIGSNSVVVYDDNWTDVVFVTDRSMYNLKISALLGAFYIDYLKIEQSETFLMTPEAYRPVDFDGEKFTAKWRSVSGAESYLVDVYTKDAEGNKNYILQQEETTETSMVVTVPDSSQKYYYCVAAKAGDNVSMTSEEQDVVIRIDELEAPVALDASDVDDNGFTANWEAVENAGSYKVSVYATETLSEARTVELLNEDFAGITEGDIDYVEFPPLQEYLDAYTTVPGWYAVNHVYASGYLGISPYGGEGSLQTPFLDLSSSNGAFVVNMVMAEYSYGDYFTGTTIKVELVDATDNVLESHDVVLDAGEFKLYTVEFTNGAANTAVKVIYDGSNKMFIDEMSVSQDYEAGDVINTLVADQETTELSYRFEFDMTSETTYSYCVTAMAATIDDDGNDVVIESEPSNMVEVGEPLDGVNAVDVAASAKVFARSGKLVVTLMADDTISVYGIDGRLTGMYDGVEGENVIEADGIVIVRLGNGEVFKAIVK